VAERREAEAVMRSPTSKRGYTERAVKELFRHWFEVDEQTGKARGELTMTYLYKTEPATYAKLVIGRLPHDIVVGNSISEMTDDDLDALLDRAREQLAARVIVDVTPAPKSPVLLPRKKK
jgi:hypothetical protein